MKTTHKLIAAVLGTAAVLSTGALAQPAGQNSAAPAPNEIVYLAQLPSAAGVSGLAQASGLTVSSIDQTNGQLLAVCKNSAGQTYVISYQSLPAAESPAPAAVAPPSAPVSAPTAAPAPATVYSYSYTTAPAPIYYYGDYSPYAYGPGWWYPGLSLGFGGYYGYGRGYGFHGGYRGGFRGGFRR